MSMKEKMMAMIIGISKTTTMVKIMMKITTVTKIQILINTRMKPKRKGKSNTFINSFIINDVLSTEVTRITESDMRISH